jgi:membrane fusion protein (multidrug efflux system)
VDQSTGSVTLRAVFPNPERDLLPGMYVRAVVEEGVLANALLIPQQAVVRDAHGKPMAMIVDGEEKVDVRPLELDRAVDGDWVVRQGLAAGDRVVVEGLQKARPGVQVRVAKDTM